MYYDESLKKNLKKLDSNIISNIKTCKTLLNIGNFFFKYESWIQSWEIDMKNWD